MWNNSFIRIFSKSESSHWRKSFASEIFTINERCEYLSLREINTLNKWYVITPPGLVHRCDNVCSICGSWVRWILPSIIFEWHSQVLLMLMSMTQSTQSLLLPILRMLTECCFGYMHLHMLWCAAVARDVDFNNSINKCGTFGWWWTWLWGRVYSSLRCADHEILEYR